MSIFDMLLANAMGESGGGGGGGGGDFSTATVTFNGTEAFFNAVPDGEGYYTALMKVGNHYENSVSINESSTFEVLMLEDSAPCLFVYSEPVITGNATAELYPDSSDWLVTITGDCTITVSS